MGIIATAHADAAASFAAFKLATTPNRAQKRRYVAALVNWGNEWLAKFDAQDARSASDFAATKPAAFNTFTDALPESVLDVVDPTL